MYNTHPALGKRRQMLALQLYWTATLNVVDALYCKITILNVQSALEIDCFCHLVTQHFVSQSQNSHKSVAVVRANAVVNTVTLVLIGR